MKQRSVGTIGGGVAFWRGHLEGWRRSGQSQRRYCLQNGVCYSNFRRWRDRLLASTTHAAAVEIVPLAEVTRDIVTPPPQIHVSYPQALVVEVGRYRLEVGDAVRMETLRSVLDVLERR